MLLFNLKKDHIRRPGQQKRQNSKARLFLWVVAILAIFGFGLSTMPGIAHSKSRSRIKSKNRVVRKRTKPRLQKMRFPRYRSLRDSDDILEYYPAYLKFVLTVGNQTNRKWARKLQDKYRTLRKYSPRAAAKFLWGLRYELEQKVQFMNKDPRKITSRSRIARTLVRKYIKEWYHEADEYLYRAVVYRKMGKKNYF